MKGYNYIDKKLIQTKIWNKKCIKEKMQKTEKKK